MSDSNRIPNFFTQSRSKFAMAWAFFKKNPLCGIKLERGAKCVAVINLILALVLMLLIIKLLVLYVPYQNTYGSVIVSNLTEKSTAPVDKSGMGSWYVETLIAVGFILSIFWFILYAILYKGISQRNYITVNRCWKIMASIAFIDGALTVVMFFVRGVIILNLTESLVFGGSLYAIWVIHAYKEELKRGADLDQSHVRGDFTEDFQRIV